MIRRGLLIVALCAAALPALVGCACTSGVARASERDCDDGDRTKTRMTMVRSERPGDLPAGAQVGECFAQVYVPPVTKTVSERVCVKEASQRIEVVPARYEWVEEKVCVKDASTHLEVVPAEFAATDHVVEVEPGYVGWVKQPAIRCTTSDGQTLETDADVFCLVKHPAQTRTIQRQSLKQQACVREVTEPAQFETVRRQKLVEKATTRTVTEPAEYEMVSKTITVAGGHMEWKRVVCEDRLTPANVNALKGALLAAGYDAGPLNGQFDANGWSALKQYQEARGLGVGALSYETLTSLGVTIQ
jgi:hypothetical protein